MARLQKLQCSFHFFLPLIRLLSFSHLSENLYDYCGGGCSTQQIVVTTKGQLSDLADSVRCEYDPSLLDAVLSGDALMIRSSCFSDSNCPIHHVAQFNIAEHDDVIHGRGDVGIVHEASHAK